MVAQPGFIVVNRHSFDAGGTGRVATGPRQAVQSGAGESFSKNILASAGEFPYSTSPHGGVAQLGERLTGSQEVRGSIPLVSTRALNEASTQVGAFFHLGETDSLIRLDKDHALNEHPSHGSIFRRGELSGLSLRRPCAFITYKGSWRNG